MQATPLRYFLEVVRTGSIAEASARLHVAGSAISRQIARLEADLGVALFERRPRGMVPSAAGELVARHARRSALDLEHMVEEVRRLQGLSTGLVRFASTDGFAIDLLPEAIGGFHRRYPGIRFDLRVLASAAVVRAVRDGDVDIGLTFGFAPEPEVRVEIEGRAPIMALMAPDHPLAARDSVALADLRAVSLGLPERDTTARQLFDIACGHEGVVIEPVLVTNYFAALWAFAEFGGGVTITGRVTVLARIHRYRLVARPLASLIAGQRRYEVQTMAGRHLPEAVSAFLTHLRGFLHHRERGTAGDGAGTVGLPSEPARGDAAEPV